MTPEQLAYLREHRRGLLKKHAGQKKTSAHYANTRAGADAYAHAYIVHRKPIVMLCSCHVSIMRGEKINTSWITALQKMIPTQAWHYNTLYILYRAIYNSLCLWFIKISFCQYDFFPLSKWPCLDMRFSRQVLWDSSKKRHLEKKSWTCTWPERRRRGRNKAAAARRNYRETGQVMGGLAHSGSRDRSKEGMDLTEKKEDGEKLAKSGRQWGPRF